MLHELTAAAGNIKQQCNPEYTVEDFLAMYPQFTHSLDDVTIGAYVNLAWDCVSVQRYGAVWRTAVGLLAAHYCTLHLQNMLPEDSTAEGVVAGSQAQGVVTSESADGVSYSTDTSLLSNDLQGWGAYKLTTYGVQFATLARLKGGGGMYIW